MAAKKKHDKYNTLKGAAACIGLITSRPDPFQRAPEIEPTAQVERTKDVILAWHKTQVSNTSKRHKKPSLQNPDKRKCKGLGERERDESLTTRLRAGGGGGGGRDQRLLVKNNLTGTSPETALTLRY